MTDYKGPTEFGVEKPKIRASLEVVYEDERRETIIVKRLANTDMIKWADTGLDKAFLVFRSVDLPDTNKRVGQEWFDSLQPESALAVVELALQLNNGPAQKKMMEAVTANLRSWLSAMPSSSSAPAATTPTP